MARPQVSDSTMQQLNRVCNRYFELDAEDVGTDKKLQTLLKKHQQLQQEVPASGVVTHAPMDTTDRL